MSAAALQSEPAASALAALAPLRVAGGIACRAVEIGGRTVLKDCRERDGYKLRLPKVGPAPELNLVNTGGGVAGGDRIDHALVLEAGTDLTVTTPAAERVYRALGGAPARIDVTLDVRRGGRLAWLPQETIFFSGAALQRRFAIELDPAAALLMAEITVFGRAALGERVAAGAFRDVWRIRRGGRLVFAEDIRLEGDIADTMAAAAVAGGAHVTATLLYAAPDAADRLERVRAALGEARCRIAASSWNGLLVVRALGTASEPVRVAVAQLIPLLTGRPVPRAWWT